MAHTPHLYLPGPWDEATLALSDSQRHHLERVLRLPEGSPLSYTDGEGRVGEGRLTGGGLKRGQEAAIERPSRVTVAVAPPRSRDRVRFLVEKLAELGVVRLLWVRTRHSEGRPPPPGKVQAWVTAALEQSRGAWAMDVGETTLEDLDPTLLVVADPAGEAAFPMGRSTLLIGPEGGLDHGELPRDVPRVSLGPTVLRVETAALAGAALLREAHR